MQECLFIHCSWKPWLAHWSQWNLWRCWLWTCLNDCDDVVSYHEELPWSGLWAAAILRSGQGERTSSARWRWWYWYYNDDGHMACQQIPTMMMMIAMTIMIAMMMMMMLILWWWWWCWWWWRIQGTKVPFCPRWELVRPKLSIWLSTGRRQSRLKRRRRLKTRSELDFGKLAIRSTIIETPNAMNNKIVWFPKNPYNFFNDIQNIAQQYLTYFYVFLFSLKTFYLTW